MTPAGITARWWGVTVDCRSPERSVAFWSALLGVEPEPADPDLPGWQRLPATDGRPRLSFQPVDVPTAGKTRLHLDLVVEDITAGTARVEDLGGRQTGERHDYDAGVVVVMADPEGTEFCLCQLYD